MSLNFGRSILAIPGPSVIPERVLGAMHQPSPNIYEGVLIETTKTLLVDLKTVARTQHDAAIYIANGHGAWEAAIRNTLNPGEKVLVLATGRFAAGWGEVASSIGAEVEVIDFGMRACTDPDRLAERLKADKSGEIKAVMTVQTDTASSVLNDIPALRKAIDSAGHDALFMVDCIASLACDRFEMDAWGVDVAVAGCQKGLMTPAGISFVYFNEKAAEKQKSTNPGKYFDWVPRTRAELYYQLFCGTAPTQHIFGLREALNMLVHEEGLEAAWARHLTIAKAYGAAVEAWGLGGAWHLNIAEPENRSSAVTSIATGEEEAARVRAWCEQEAGVTLGIGLGFGSPGSATYNSHFRIGHMGHNNVPMVMGVIGSIDTALKALKIPHGQGASTAAASVLAAHG